MTTPNLNWSKVAAALAATSPYGPFFGPDGAIYGPDGSTLVPPASERIRRNTNGFTDELQHAPNRTWRAWGRTSHRRHGGVSVFRPRPG
jgi:hypothetical protein